MGGGSVEDLGLLLFGHAATLRGNVHLLLATAVILNATVKHLVNCHLLLATLILIVRTTGAIQHLLNLRFCAMKLAVTHFSNREEILASNAFEYV